MSDSKREEAREAIYRQIADRCKTTRTSEEIESFSRAWGNIEYGPEGGHWEGQNNYRYDHHHHDQPRGRAGFQAPT
jgi:hypothetical protein